MAASNMAIFGGAFFTPILVGKITHTLGWQWTFNLIAIFAGALFPFIFFFVPETAFWREDHFNTDTMRGDAQQHAPVGDESSHPGISGYYDPERSLKGPRPVPQKVSFARSLMPFNGWKTNENPWKLILRPFPLFFHPAVLWGCLIQGTMIGWTVFIGVVLAAIFLGPPLWFDEVETGYMYAGPFIGAVLGFIVAGVLSDWSTKWMIRKNNGVYEPEFRIVLVIVQLIVGCAGLYGFGEAAANIQPGGWFLPDFFFALEVMGMVIGAVASALYIVDAHREIAVEAFTCLLIFKNILSFGLTWSAYDWLVEAGILKIFLAISSVQVVICLLSIPMCKYWDTSHKGDDMLISLVDVFGKRNRALMRRYDILKMTHLW